MKLRWLRPFVVLVAALIVLISNIVSKRPMLSSLLWLLAAIVVFYIIGSICTRVIQRVMAAANEAKQQAEETAKAQTDHADDSKQEAAGEGK